MIFGVGYKAYTKPDIVSPADRALIDDFPPDQIQFIPRGVSGLEPGQFVGTNLNRQGQPPALRAKLARERGEYRRRFDAGETPEQIAAGMVVHPKSVRNALKRMGLIVKPLAPKVTANPRRNNDDQIRQMWRDGRSQKDICAATGMCASSLYRALKRLDVIQHIPAGTRGDPP